MSQPAGRRLIIVEDEGIVALDLERSLRALGFDVRGVAADSEAALELARVEKPDLALMDIRIQGTRDGVETAALLRSEHDVPVVFLTAHGDPATIDRAQKTSPLGYLLKPFKKPDLQNVISIALARKEVERDLRQREQVLQTTMDCIGEAIISTSLDGRITWVNRAASVLLGVEASALTDQPVERGVPLPGELMNELVHRTRVEHRVHVEGPLAAPDGTHNVVGTSALIASGQLEFGLVIVLRDLTELLQARRQLEFSERLSALGTLAAGVAHELNNPLAVVLSNLRFIADENTSDTPGMEQCMTDARDAGERMRQLIAELQTFSRPQQEHLHPSEPASALGAALSFTRSRWKRVTSVSLELGPTPLVLAAPIKLSQVFINLLLNAAQAMEPIDEAHHLIVRTGTTAEGDALLSVEDNGPGIPPALRERIFEPFFTTKAAGKGTGLGLAISRTIVEQHHGTLSVSAGANGKGTRFSLVLPRCVAERPTLPPPFWVGTPRVDVEGCTVIPPEAKALETALAAERHAPVLSNPAEALPDDVRAMLPDLDVRSLRVEEVGMRGVMSLRPGFDPQTVSALFQRNG